MMCSPTALLLGLHLVILNMINLLPHNYREGLKRSYYIQLASLTAIFVGLVVILALAFLVPSYNLSVNKQDKANDTLATMQTTGGTSDQELPNATQDIGSKLAIFNTQKTFIFSRDAVEPLVRHSEENKLIKISAMGFTINKTPATKDQVAKEVTTINVSGEAATREALLAFVQSLRQEAHFKGVDVPVSNFVQGSDINFTIQFTFQ